MPSAVQLLLLAVPECESSLLHDVRLRWAASMYLALSDHSCVATLSVALTVTNILLQWFNSTKGRSITCSPYRSAALVVPRKRN